MTSQEQLVDTVQRLDSRPGSTVVYGRVHPRIGTHNFTMRLRDGHYIEVVYSLNHPASDTSPFEKVVTKRVLEGGGWLTWVVSVDGAHHAKIVKIEIVGDEKTIEDYCGCNIAHAVGDIEVVWANPADNDGENGIGAVYLPLPNGVVRFDQ